MRFQFCIPAGFRAPGGACALVLLAGACRAAPGGAWRRRAAEGASYDIVRRPHFAARTQFAARAERGGTQARARALLLHAAGAARRQRRPAKLAWHARRTCALHRCAALSHARNPRFGGAARQHATHHAAPAWRAVSLVSLADTARRAARAGTPQLGPVQATSTVPAPRSTRLCRDLAASALHASCVRFRQDLIGRGVLARPPCAELCRCRLPAPLRLCVQCACCALRHPRCVQLRRRLRSATVPTLHWAS